MTSSSMSLEERFEALMKQNEFLVSKVREDSQKEQETRAQNEYLRKQLGSFLKQKQRMNEETLQSEPRRYEQVQSHDVGSSSEEEVPRRPRREPRNQHSTNDFRVEIPEFEGKLDPEEFGIGFTPWKECSITKMLQMTRESSLWHSDYVSMLPYGGLTCVLNELEKERLKFELGIK